MNKLICSIAFSALLFSNAIGGSAAPAITICYVEPAQVELISSKGTRILIDVYQPSQLSYPATEFDILLTTHTHSDHLNEGFLSSFRGKQLFVRTGEIKTADVSIQGISSAHNEGDPLLPESGTNYIFIVDMDGLRIAHFGDIGQNSLTPEQLAALGKVDIAVTQFDNDYSQMDVANKKGFKLMQQVRPLLIIPTHNSVEAVKYAMTLWPCLYSDSGLVRISRDNLPKDTHLLFLGSFAEIYGKLTNASHLEFQK